MSKLPHRVLRWAAPAFTAVLTACATQTLGDRLGTEVVAFGSNQVDLRWDVQHAWHALLAERGADLVAEYKTPTAGLVREVLASVRSSPNRTLSFKLPPGLKGIHEGPVCLYIQVPANRSVLPVRKAQGPGVDTARFRFARWEDGVAAQAALRAAQGEVAALERQLAALDGGLKSRSASLATRGWSTAAACDAIPVRPALSTRPPIGVLPPEQHDAAARHACINRMVNSARYREAKVDAAQRAATANELIGHLRAASGWASMGEQSATMILQIKTAADGAGATALAARQREAAAFREDWRLFADRVGRDYYPPIGKPDERLELIGAAHDTHLKFLVGAQAERLGLPADKRPELTTSERLGLAGGMLDSYKGCVSDGRSELKSQLAAWTDLQRDTPERNQRIRDHFVAECRSEHDQLARVSSERSRIEAELSRAQQKLAQIQPAAPSKTVAEGGSGQLLNSLACQ